jgi:phenylpropionate dioxygenase-like ring-hydroxylating dioxygenase large terminal subunit
MDRAVQLRLTRRLRAELEGAAAEAWPSFVVAAERYRDPSWHARERAALFGDPASRWPRVVAASTELARGTWLPCDLPGLALLLTRDADGRVHAFRNACRHRGTRLVDSACASKAVVCPYHGWTYDLAGALVHVPHEGAFVGLDRSCRGLAEVPVVEQHGLVWQGGDAAHRLTPLARDLAALGLDDHVVWRRSRVVRRCNWKLVVEAFLDGYHIRVLHRGSIYPFFLDAASLAEPDGPHIRAVTGRRTLRETSGDLDGADLRQLGTPSYLVFPSTVIIEHPDFVSIIGLEPIAANETAWDHMLLVPRARAEAREHWEKSWALIDETVFQREDLWVCEQIQRSLDAGATDELLFGALEHAVKWFHDALELALDGSGRR